MSLSALPTAAASAETAPPVGDRNLESGDGDDDDDARPALELLASKVGDAEDGWCSVDDEITWSVLQLLLLEVNLVILGFSCFDCGRGGSRAAGAGAGVAAGAAGARGNDGRD